MVSFKFYHPVNIKLNERNEIVEINPFIFIDVSLLLIVIAIAGWYRDLY